MGHLCFLHLRFHCPICDFIVPFVQVGDFDYEYSIDNLVKAGETLPPSFSKKDKNGYITSHTEKVHPSVKNILFDDSGRVAATIKFCVFGIFK